MKAAVISFLLLLVFPSFAQHPLPKSINELSGLVFINDSVLVGHNDGGDQPNLYFLTTKGKLLHTCTLSNVTNVDWEDITYDGSTFLYIGDIGNNENKRKDLKIIRVNAKEAFKKEQVEAQTFSFTYPEQKSFPPKPNEKYYDAEALTFYNNKLYIFTKCRTEPWDGWSQVYELSVDMKDQEAKRLSPLLIGKNGWWQDAVTGADIRHGNCYILTYNRVMIYKINGDKMTFVKRFYLDPITQKEAIAVDKEGNVYVGDEASKLIGGGSIYFFSKDDQ